MHNDAPLSDHEENVAIEDLYDALVMYGQGTPRLLRMLLQSVRETLAVYQAAELERVALIERMYGSPRLAPPEPNESR